MSTTTTSQPALLTVEDVGSMPDPGYPFELVRGRIVRMPPPVFRHGTICAQIVGLVDPFVRAADLGRVVCNDSGVITRRNPDSLRGADVAVYSFARMPREITPDGYPDVAPDAVFEVRSPSDRMAKVFERISEYLEAGVLAVCLVDPASRTVTVYRPDVAEVRLSASEEFALPDILPGFSCRVAEFFA